MCECVTRQLKIQEPANKAVCAELFEVFCTRHVQGIRRYVSDGISLFLAQVTRSAVLILAHEISLS